MNVADSTREPRGLVDAPAIDENDADQVRHAIIVATDAAADLRALLDRLRHAGLLARGWGPKQERRLAVAAERWDAIAKYLRARLAKLEPAADERGKP